MKRIFEKKGLIILSLLSILLFMLIAHMAGSFDMFSFSMVLLVVVITVLVSVFYVKARRDYADMKESIHQLTEDVSKKYQGSSGLLNAKNYIGYLRDEIGKYQIENGNLKAAYNILDQGVLLFNTEFELIYYNQQSKRIFKLSETSLLEPLQFIIRDYKLKQLILDGEDQESFEYVINNERFLVKLFSSGYRSKQKEHIRAMVVFKSVQKDYELIKMKRDFFAHASHELKTPLTAILGHLELIDNHMISHEELPDIIKRIIFQANHMTYLIEDMLILSQLESVEEETYDSINLSTNINLVIDQLSEMAKSKKITIHKEIDANTLYPMSIFDSSKLFKNLIENAIKYSAEGQTIELALTQEDDQIIFKVRDYGIGIDPKYQDRIFQRFYRINKGRIEEGTGLGLSIVKHIVLKYKGQIEVESNLDEGALFKVTLPN